MKKSAVKIEFTINYTDRGLKQELKLNTQKKSVKKDVADDNSLQIILYYIHGIEKPGTYYLRMALMWRDSFIKDRNDKPCALTSDKFTSTGK